MVLYVVAQNVFSLVNKNDPFSISGLVILKSKNRFPIPAGDRTLLLKRVTCDFQGRLAKFRQMEFTPTETYLYLLLDITELFRLGYSLCLIKKPGKMLVLIFPPSQLGNTS